MTNTQRDTRPLAPFVITLFKSRAKWLAILASVLMLSGCATGALGGYPGQSYPDQQYPGQSYPGQQYPDQYGAGQYGSNQVVGSVDGLDPRNGRIVLIRQDAGYGGGARMDVYYDQRTRLVYQGRQHPVSGLERGDVIRIDAVQAGGRLLAQNIEVLRNVRDPSYQGDAYGGGQYGGGQYGGGQYGDNRYGGGSQYGGDLRGTVGFVDPRARVIEIDNGRSGGGYGNAGVRVRYDQRTVVEYQGRAYRPQDLDRGDLVRVQARQLGANDWLAERIVVERSVR